MIEKTIEELLVYAKYHLGLEEDDTIYYRNMMLRKLNGKLPYEGSVNEEEIKELKVPDTIIEKLSEYILKENIVTEDKLELFLTELMGDLTPLPSKVNEVFKSQESDKALDYLYDLSIKNNYIQKTKVDKNILWEASFSEANIEISINLSKPEKNNKDIRKLLTKSNDVKYPKCLLCKENVGFAGNSGHPARENLRIIPLNLNNEKWYLQYSPYVYYDHHCIVFNDRHANMHIDRSCFNALADFVDTFPSFFIGSNSDLPIVGGSILNHEHFQGGKHILPMLKCNNEYDFYTIGDTLVSKLNWYNTAISLKSKNKDEMLNIAECILNTWISYSDEENEILAHTTERHNTITPIVRKIEDTYYMYLILRNNRCNDENPDGIFHAHKEYHMIKKEGIGLIEAMGLFILPARLKRQFNEIAECKKANLNDEEIVAKYPGLEEFLPMIHEIKGENLTEEIVSYVNNVCKNILCNVAVFKNTEKGNQGLKKFMDEVLKKYE